MLRQADFDRLPKGLRGIPVWRAEITGELWPETEDPPDDPDEWRDECDDPSREDEEEDEQSSGE